MPRVPRSKGQNIAVDDKLKVLSQFEIPVKDDFTADLIGSIALGNTGRLKHKNENDEIVESALLEDAESKIPLAQKNKKLGVPGLSENTISHVDVVEGILATFKSSSSITDLQLDNFPEWYKEDEAIRYARTDYKVSPNNFGAYGDGVHRPLSSLYISLAVAQMKYPFATSLEQSIDCMAMQKAINFLADLGGGTVTINDNDKYYLNYGSVFITKSNINVIGSGTILNGTIDLNGETNSSVNRRFYGVYSGFKTKFSSITPNKTATTNAGIRLQYCSRLNISGIYFENCDVDVHVVRRNATQHVSRVTIQGCTGQYANNHIYIDGDESLTTSFYEIGDFLIANNFWVWAYYTQVHGYGVDGFRMNGDYFFSFPPDGSNLLTKEYNIDLFKVNFSSLTNLNLFEAGLDSIRIRKYSNVTISNVNIAWPGQRKPSGGINLSGGNISVTSGTLDNITTITNVNIERPSKYGISIGRIPDPNDPSGNTLIDDPNPMGKMSLSGIITSKVGNLDKYYGTDPIGTTNSIYTSTTTSGIDYKGINDSSQSRMSINGTRSKGEELQTSRGVYEKFLSPDTVLEDNLDFETAYNFVENLQPASNRFDLWSLNSASVSQAVSTEVETTSQNVAVYKITESTTNVQHVMIGPVAAKTGDGIFTTYFKTKAKEIQALEFCIGSSVGGIGLRLDVNIEGKKSIGTTISDPTYRFEKIQIKKIENDYCYVRCTYYVPAATPNIQLSIYLKQSTTQPGNPAYQGDGAASFYITEVQTSRTKEPLPFLSTGSAQILRSPLSLFLNRTSVRTESFTSPDDIIMLGQLAANKTVTLKNPTIYMNKFMYIDNANNNNFKWIVSSLNGLLDANGNTITELFNQAKYVLLSNGINWVIYSLYFNNVIENSVAVVAPTLGQLNALSSSITAINYTNDAVLMSYTRINGGWLQSPAQKVI